MAYATYPNPLSNGLINVQSPEAHNSLWTVNIFDGAILFWSDYLRILQIILAFKTILARFLKFCHLKSDRPEL